MTSPISLEELIKLKDGDKNVIYCVIEIESILCNPANMKSILEHDDAQKILEIMHNYKIKKDIGL